MLQGQKEPIFGGLASMGLPCRLCRVGEAVPLVAHSRASPLQ